MYTLITGATGGLGRAFAFAFAKRGNDLFLTGRSFPKLNILKAEISKSFDVDVVICACDLTSIDDRNNLFSFIDQNHIQLDGLVNVAGVDTQKAFSLYTMEKVLFQIRVNVEATICFTHAFISRFIDNKPKILTISSMSGVSPMPYFALYSATKSCLTSFFTSLHYELKNSGSNVTVVLPGGIYTRPDICKDIKGQGLWGKLSAKSPRFVAEKSIKALYKNKIKYIPGFFNRFLNFLMKIAPKKIVLSFIAKRWKNIEKDAF